VIKLRWSKCPSVTYGGKPHFWRNAEHDLTVVWDRSVKKWILKHNDAHTPADGLYYSTTDTAMKGAAEAEFNKTQTTVTKKETKL